MLCYLQNPLVKSVAEIECSKGTNLRERSGKMSKLLYGKWVAGILRQPTKYIQCLVVAKTVA